MYKYKLIASDKLYLMGVKIMAVVSSGYELNVTLIDGGSNQSTVRFALTAADAATAATDAGTILTALGDVTDAVVKSYSIAERFVEDSLTLPANTVHVENRALVTLQLASNPTKTVTIKIPAASEGIFQGLSGSAFNVVDPNDTELRAYVALFHAAGEATISDGESVAPSPSGGILRGVRSHRKSYGG